MKNPSNVIFIAGIGAHESLYTDYLNNLKKHFPNIHVLEWWNQEDFGMHALQSFIGDSEVMLISHSAGSVMALAALQKWPRLIKKIIMLDSHFKRSTSELPSVSRMLEIILNDNNVELHNKVKRAYAPVIENDFAFNRALKFAIQWVNDSFDQGCALLNSMPAHSVLYIGFSNQGYQILSAEDEKAILALWGKYGVDVRFMPMGHFDLIEDNHATNINQLIADWLSIL